LLVEADAEPNRLDEYFAHGDEMRMLFNFVLVDEAFLAFARQSAQPLSRLLRLFPDIRPPQRG
jgi:hypothetical protein